MNSHKLFDGASPLFPAQRRQPAQPSLFSARPDDDLSRVPVYRIELVRERDVPVHYGVASTPAEIYAFVRPLFARAARERCVVVLLDAGNQIIGASTISQGGLTSAIVEPRAVFEVALMANAASVVLAHNHPSGRLEPSNADRDITRRCVEVGKAMAVPVVDHLIVGATGYMSFAERGLI